MAARGCAIDGCERSVTSRGWCEMHYRRWRRTGTTDPPARGPSVCTVEGCDLPVDTRGLCHGHDQRVRRTGSVQAQVPLGRRRQPERCTVDGCDRPTKGHGLCGTHWWRRWRHGDVGAPDGRRLPEIDGGEGDAADGCDEDGCDGPAIARRRCAPCYKAALRAGEVEVDPDVRVITGQGWVSHGYWGVVVPEEDRHLVGGQRSAGEHRLVMARHLDRPLAPDEQVHHINGNRLDNRLENLELWSTSHPSGQRAEDKVEWAIAMLRRYRPDLLEKADDHRRAGGHRG